MEKEQAGPTIAQAVVQVGRDSNGGQPQVEGLLEACRHPALECGDFSGCDLHAGVPALRVGAVVGDVALQQHGSKHPTLTTSPFC